MVSWWRVGWWRDGFSVTSWLVAKLPGGEMTGYRDKGSRQQSPYTYSYSALPENRKDENRKMWKLKDVKIVAAEISIINSVPVHIKFSRVLTLSRMRPSLDV